MKRPVPRATVQRLPLYLQLLEEWDGPPRLSSDQLAALAGVNAAKVRKDLSHLGSYGVRGIGYEGFRVDAVGRTLHLEIEAPTAEEARSIVDEMCRKLLVNPSLETYEIDLAAP